MNNKSILVSKGKECSNCGSIMNRMRHPDNWKPSKKQSYYFSEWDICGNCRYLQHYEIFRVCVKDLND